MRAYDPNAAALQDLPRRDLEIIKARNALYAAIRSFFNSRDVLEVETPILASSGNPDPNIQSFKTSFHEPGGLRQQTLWLHTSPEFFMKRLLAAGSGPIFQIAKVFRDEEFGQRHNPEFSMLEWYRPQWDYQQLIDEVVELISSLVPIASVQKLSYQQAFEMHAGVDPYRATMAELAACLQRADIDHSLTASDGRDSWLDLILTHLVEPDFARHDLVVLFDYPASQASLAELSNSEPRVARRFEVYVRGLELANGYQENCDAGDQRARFEKENAQREKQGCAKISIDRFLINAMADGLPRCSGVALGLDRLLMLKHGVSDIGEILAFPANIA
jgi:lysyl-tRNA synthetase class 2